MLVDSSTGHGKARAKGPWGLETIVTPKEPMSVTQVTLPQRFCYWLLESTCHQGLNHCYHLDSTDG